MAVNLLKYVLVRNPRFELQVINVRAKFSADFLLSTFGGSSNAGSSPYVTVIYRFNLGGTKLMGC